MADQYFIPFKIEFRFYFFIFCCLFYITPSNAMPTVQPNVNSELSAMLYLQQFGYVEQSSQKSGAMISEDTMTESILQFQRFAGLNETGVLDNNTVYMMNMPRCGIPDKVTQGSSARKKRYALQGSKWRVKDITYRIAKYTNRLSHSQVDKEISKGFKIWSDVTPLNFIERKSGRVHIDIRFERKRHGDGDPFDGPGRTLAHAFFPVYGGDAHFDDDERWTVNTRSGTNLYQVAAHELGHSLGLSHSDVRSALMAPFYRGYDSNLRLNRDDIQAIQRLYGKRTGKQVNKSPDPPMDPAPGAPDLCQDSSIDAVTRTGDGSTYVFKGDFYWEILQSGIAEGYPRRIDQDFKGLPGNLDAALTWGDGKTFFFKGSNYWKFKNKAPQAGYPKQISVGFAGIPDNIGAAFVWNGNGKTYIFKGDQYWRFDSKSEIPVSSQYPRSIDVWKGLPSDINAAFQWENGRMYFFKGSNYYRLDDKTFAVEDSNPAYPRSTAPWWFDCKAMSLDGLRKSELHSYNKKEIILNNKKVASGPIGNIRKNVGREDFDVSIIEENDDSEPKSRHPRSSPIIKERNGQEKLVPGRLVLALLIFLKILIQ